MQIEYVINKIPLYLNTRYKILAYLCNSSRILDNWHYSKNLSVRRLIITYIKKNKNKVIFIYNFKYISIQIDIKSFEWEHLLLISFSCLSHYLGCTY